MQKGFVGERCSGRALFLEVFDQLGEKERKVDVDKGVAVGRNDESARRELPKSVRPEDVRRKGMVRFKSLI